MYKRALVSFLLCLILCGCGATYYGKGKAFLEKEDYDLAIENLYQAVTQNPKKAENWRELGIAYYKKGESGKALDALKQANLIKPDHKTIFYLGLVYEKKEDFDSAINAYKRYMLLKPKGKMAKKIEIRLKILQNKRIEEIVRKRLAEEESLEVAEIPSNTVGVTYFNTSGLDSSLAVLSKGLAEFLTTDLSKVEKLTVLERLKLERLLEELEFGRTEYVDKSTAPRVGKLLGAYQLVTGSILGVGGEKLRIDAGLVLTPTGEISSTPEAIGEVKEFFKLEKELVFGIIEKMGVELTKAERDEIKKIPTESFLAILAYCRGVDYLDYGMYQEAETQFGKALSQDPNFQDALNQYQGVKDLLEHKASVEDLSNFEIAYEELEREDVLEERLSQTHGNSSLIQGPSADNPHTPAVISLPPPAGTVIIEGTLQKKR